MDGHYNSSLLHENEIPSKLELQREKPGDGNSREGYIKIVKSGQPVVEFLDAFWHLAKNLCFEYIPDHLDNKTECFKYGYYVTKNYLAVTDSINTIKTIGDSEDIPAAYYPKNEFLPALQDCAQGLLIFWKDSGFIKVFYPC